MKTAAQTAQVPVRITLKLGTKSKSFVLQPPYPEVKVGDPVNFQKNQWIVSKLRECPEAIFIKFPRRKPAKEVR